MSTIVEASANGRVNLIGEHTDYNGGWVLPTAIPQKTTVRLTPRADQQVIARTSAGGANHEFTLGREAKTGEWIDYVQGATFLLSRDGFRISGFEIDVESTVPMGSGLSSSAALEVALLKALRQAFSLDLNDNTLAKLGQRIENEFVGANVGIMDQMACSLARFGEALFLDTFKMTHENVTIPFDRMDLIVMNSGVTHRNSASGGYNQRRAECESAARALGVGLLREIPFEDLAKLDRLPMVERRRARHVITENERVHQAVQALRAGDLSSLGRLFYESHASMRDDYEVSVHEIDLLVELCRAEPAVYGARLTGGGFGGSIVTIVRKGEGPRVAKAVKAQYDTMSGSNATILVP